MTDKPKLMLVEPPPPEPCPKQDRRVKPKQMLGVESPAVVMLTPVLLNKGTAWWSHEGILVGGVVVNQISNGDHDWVKEPQASNLIGYAPTWVPKIWQKKAFNVCVEYEGEREAAFSLRVHYGCGDPSELHVHESDLLTGNTEGKSRERFPITHIDRRELLRASLEIRRNNGLPVLIYGAWLEIGVEAM